MKVYSLFLITSGYVWSALVEFKKGAPPVLLYSESIALPIDPNPEKDKIEKSIINTVMLAAANLAVVSKEKKVSLENNVVVLASPWYVGEAKIVTQAYKRNTVIKQAMVDELIKQQITKFESDNNLQGAAILENKVTSITLNGYSTVSPFNKKANNLAFSLFFSLTTDSFKKNLDEVFTKELHFDKQIWHSLPVFMFGCLINQLDQAKQPKDFLILDIGAEVSEMAIVRGGIFLETVSMPFGSNHIVRAVADRLKMTTALAESLLRLQKEGSTNEINTSRLSEIFASQEVIWKTSLLPSLVNLSGGLSLPTTLYLMCDDKTSKFFKQSLLNEDYSESSMTGSKFNILEVDFKIFCNSLALTI